MSTRSGATPTSPSRSWLWAVLWLSDLALLVAMWLTVNSSWFSGARSKFFDAALAIVAACLVFLTRRVFLCFSAARAGTVEIAADDSVSRDVLAAFREALTEVYLSSPSTVPGESTPHDFLSDVKEAATAKTGWGVAFMTLAAIFRVRAFKVSCTTPARGAGDPKVLALEVSSKVSKDVQVTTISDATWEDVARRAACHVAAYVLPRTFLARNPPWTAWRHCQVKPDLFYHFQEARRLAQSGRLEESLSHFDRATDLDPLNPYIRIERATVLDELGLYVDALAAYVDVVTTESWYDRKLWGRYRAFFGDENGWDTAPRRPRSSPNGHAALQLARYRVVCSLAASDRLAKQWHRHYHSRTELEQKKAAGASLKQPLRTREAHRVIAMLRPLLRPFYGNTMEGSSTSAATASVEIRDIEADEPLLRRVMQYAALYEAQHLERDYRWTKPRRWHHKLLISQSAIRFLPVWAALQYRYVETVQARLHGSAENALVPTVKDVPILEINDLRRPLHLGRTDRSRSARKNPSNHSQSHPAANSWPPDVEQVQVGVRWALGRHAGGRGWLEHYNAACTYAVGMLTPELYPRAQCGHLQFGPEPACTECAGPDTLRYGRPSAHPLPKVPLHEEEAKRHDQLVRLAISQLSHAVTASDSQFAAGISPWLRRGDQDLNDLRATELYDTFVDRYLSPGASWPPVPPNVAILIMSAHMLHLVQQFCRGRQARWEERARSSMPVDWTHIAEEGTCWEGLREFCENHRDWRTREKFIILAKKTGVGDEFDTSIPALEDDEGWLGKAQPAQPVGGGSILLPTQKSLQQSMRLHDEACSLIKSRNKVLKDLAKSLGTPCCLGSRLAEVSRAAQLTPIQPASGSAALLANAWRALALSTSLRGQKPAPHCRDDIARVRKQFMLYTPSKFRRSVR